MQEPKRLLSTMRGRDLSRANCADQRGQLNDQYICRLAVDGKGQLRDCVGCAEAKRTLFLQLWHEVPVTWHSCILLYVYAASG